jgi:hypothetical protein
MVAIVWGSLLVLSLTVMLYIGDTAQARPNCNVPDPPPVCDGDGGPDGGPPPPQPPPNDNWANAIDLGSITYLNEARRTGTSKLASIEPGEPRPHDPTRDCGIFGVSNSVWYKVTPKYQLRTRPHGKIHLSTEGSSFDTVLALYEGSSLTSLRQVACSNDNSGPNWTDRLSAEVNRGQTYYIQLLGTGGARSGDFSLKASQCATGCVRVATFNACQGCLMQTHPDSEEQRRRVIEGWGRNLLSRADVVFLNEVRNDEWVSLMSQSSGLRHWYSAGFPCPHTDVAIVSRYPLYNQARFEIPPVRFIPRECFSFLVTQEILQAWGDIDGIPHRFYATHWHHGWKSRAEDAPERIASAEKSRDLIEGDPSMAFYGGDLNECRPSSAEDPNNLCVIDGTPMAAPGTSITLLQGALRDSLTDLRLLYGTATDRVSNCDPAPIDDVFYRNVALGGPAYEPVEYTSNCGPENFPSDHPFVLVAFERTPPAPFTPAMATASPTATTTASPPATALPTSGGTSPVSPIYLATSLTLMVSGFAALRLVLGRGATS